MVFVTKCLRADPERRLQLLAFIAWWFRWELFELGRNRWLPSDTRLRSIPPAMIWASSGAASSGCLGATAGRGGAWTDPEELAVNRPPRPCSSS